MSDMNEQIRARWGRGRATTSVGHRDATSEAFNAWARRAYRETLPGGAAEPEPEDPYASGQLAELVEWASRTGDRELLRQLIEYLLARRDLEEQELAELRRRVGETAEE